MKDLLKLKLADKICIISSREIDNLLKIKLADRICTILFTDINNLSKIELVVKSSSLMGLLKNPLNLAYNLLWISRNKTPKLEDKIFLFCGTT